MGELRWFRQDKAEVGRRLKAGERPKMATSTAAGPLDELVALYDELGVFGQLVGLENGRERSGLDDDLLMRTLAVLPFVGSSGLSAVADLLFREPTILLKLGWAPVQIRQGDNDRHRSALGRQMESLPCHPDTLRDALARITEGAWLKAQTGVVRGLFEHRLVRGRVYAVDGTGLGSERRVVALVCVSSTRPILVAWRYLEGKASEKGAEAKVTKELVEQALGLGGEKCIDLLLADALYADGPLLAWLKYEKGIDALVSLPSDRLIYEDLQGLVKAELVGWMEHRYLRVIRGHKQLRKVALAGVGELDNWESFRKTAEEYGAKGAKLWACLVREIEPDLQRVEEAGALVSTREWPRASEAFLAYRARWVIEDDVFRELKEGFGLEKRPWGEQGAIVRGRVSLTLFAYNTVQVYRTKGGERLVRKGIRRLRLEKRRELGPAPAVIYLDDCFGVFTIEELLAVLGVSVEESLLPSLSPKTPTSSPPP